MTTLQGKGTPGYIAPPRVKDSPRKDPPLWASCLVGAFAGLVFAAWLLLAHIEYVNRTAMELYCWDFSGGDLSVDRECNRVLAYE